MQIYSWYYKNTFLIPFNVGHFTLHNECSIQNLYKILKRVINVKYLSKSMLFMTFYQYFVQNIKANFTGIGPSYITAPQSKNTVCANIKHGRYYHLHHFFPSGQGDFQKAQVYDAICINWWCAPSWVLKYIMKNIFYTNLLQNEHGRWKGIFLHEYTWNWWLSNYIAEYDVC